MPEPVPVPEPQPEPHPGSVFAIWLYNLFVNLLIADLRLGRGSFGPEYLHDQQGVSFGKFV